MAKHEKTTKVFILTKSGEIYSDEGTKCVLSSIYDIYDDKRKPDEFDFLMGTFLNDPDAFISNLEQCKNSYLAVSLPDRIYIYQYEDYPCIFDWIHEKPNQNPWNTIMEQYTIWKKYGEPYEEPIESYKYYD